MMLSKPKPEENIDVESKAQEPLSTETTDDRAKELERRLAMLGVEDDTEEITDTEEQPELTIDLSQPTEDMTSPDQSQVPAKTLKDSEKTLLPSPPFVGLEPTPAVEAPKMVCEENVLRTSTAKPVVDKKSVLSMNNRSTLLVSR